MALALCELYCVFIMPFLDFLWHFVRWHFPRYSCDIYNLTSYNQHFLYNYTFPSLSVVPHYVAVEPLKETVDTETDWSMPISHRRRGQDKTVLSCFVRVGGVI